MNPLTFSIPTVGASPAATFVFFSRGYQTPAQGRSVAWDEVHNQNGPFKYIYDNGPNSYKWAPFELIFEDKFSPYTGGSATQQWENFLGLWNHIGSKGFQAPEAVYTVHFTSNSLERRFMKFPQAVGDKIEFAVTIELAEG